MLVVMLMLNWKLALMAMSWRSSSSASCPPPTSGSSSTSRSLRQKSSARWRRGNGGCAKQGDDVAKRAVGLVGERLFLPRVIPGIGAAVRMGMRMSVPMRMIVVVVMRVF